MKVPWLWLALLLLTFFSRFDHTQVAKVFKWVDQDGVVHFSDRAPEGVSPEGGVQERELEERKGGEEDPTSIRIAPRNAVEYALNATFTIESSGSMGSGFFISSEGYAVTCKHVIRNGGSPVAVLMNRERCPVKIISESPTHDLALVLVLTEEKTKALPLRNPESLVTGDRIFAVGTPLGFSSTVTDGIFTGFRQMEGSGERLIQFSAPVNPGNSGGPLIDEGGRVVGIVTSKVIGDERAPSTGLGFALPSDLLLKSYGDYIHSAPP